MLNLTPTRALSRRAQQLLTYGFVAAALGVLLAVVGLLGYAIPPVPPGHPSFPLVNAGRVLLLVFGVAGIAGGVALIIRALTRRRENELALIVGNSLSDYLDASYTFIRNINPPGPKYIDAALIGTPGVLVMRILGHTGNFGNEGANWIISDSRGEWRPLRFNPTRQVVDDIRLMRDLLAKRKLDDIPVFGVIVFVDDAVQIFDKDPVVPVAQLNNLVDKLRRDYLAKTDRISPQAAAAVRTLLLG
jgi:hypothetical protein